MRQGKQKTPSSKQFRLSLDSRTGGRTCRSGNSLPPARRLSRLPTPHLLLSLHFPVLESQVLCIKYPWASALQPVPRFNALSLGTGVDFWGVLNPEWKLCKEGKRQSPVSINPESLIFDPNLRPLLIENIRVRDTDLGIRRRS